MLCNRRGVTYSKRGLQMADRSGPSSPFRGHSFFAWWQWPPWRGTWWCHLCQIEYQHCVGRCRPTRHPVAPENGRNLKGLAISNSLSKVCKLAIVILYVAGFMVQTKVSELEQRQRWRHEWQMEVWLFQFAWGNTYNYPGCQRLFMRGFRFRSRLVAAGEKIFGCFYTFRMHDNFEGHHWNY